MIKKINILDENTINKISAGEVVERPSSIIKELVENSIDAGAKKIIIEITDGGKSLIKVTDNGHGILSSEVEKSILRHATSKIKEIDDLYNLYSLGFRGEALSSICSISKFEMITKTKEELVGTRLLVNGGKKELKEPIGTNNGTSIIIRDIFFNTPARAKFLKSNQAESINITELINRFCILNPSINFKYINNKKQIINTPGNNNLLSVIRTIHGREICENLISINYESEVIKINGFIGNNNIYRSNRNNQYISINNRMVKSRLLLEGISDAYKGIIPINKHAICFLEISVNPSKIDVNIHPTKLEVKFEEDKKVYFEFVDVIRKSLLNTNLIGKAKLKSNFNIELKEKNDLLNIENNLKKEIKHFKGNKENKFIIPKYEKVNIDNIKNIDIEKEKVSEFNLFNDENNNNIINKDSLDNTKNYLSSSKLVKNTYDSSLNSKVDNKELIKETLQESFFEKKDDKRVNFLDYNIIGTLFDTYIILSNKENMYLLDQHASHEKIIYEKYIKSFTNKQIQTQILLNPIVIQLSRLDMERIEKNIDLFKVFGFEIDLFGKNHIMVRSVPVLFESNESEKFILEIIDNLDKIDNIYELKESKIISMACKKAIKANDSIKNMEIKKLLSDLNECENPFTCPHGRPIIIEIKKTDIEKMFKRIM